MKATTLLMIIMTSFTSQASSELIDKVIEKYSNTSSNSKSAKILRTKGSDVNLCSYRKVKNGISAKVLSVSNVPGNKYTTILIMDKYACNILNDESMQEYSDIYTLTSVAKVNESPNGVDIQLDVIQIQGQQSVHDLEEAVSY